MTGESATPVPAKLVVLVPPGASCVTVSVPLRLPDAAGANDTLILQLDPAARLPPAAQEPTPTGNSPLPVEMPVMFSAAVPLLDSVAVCAVLVEPTLTLPKLRDGVNEAAGAGAAVAVPLRATVLGLPVALCAIESEPLRAPVAPAAGWKVSDTVQLAPGATLPPAAQVPPAIAKSAVLLSVNAESTRGAVPVLETVEFCAALVLPMAVLASVNEVGDTDAAGAVAAAAPVPLSAMTTGVNVLLWVMFSAPLLVPAAVGVNETITVQLMPAATDVPHVPPARAKSPVTETLRPLIA